MFFGVDYQNDALANIVAANQFFLGSNSNVKVSPYDETDHTNWEIKRNVPVEVMYVIYTLWLELF
ncbi:hypothetical protein [Mesoplasma melaleucae]|uniref:Uncharacterized protein n=1 Tax=Mesoplasma melaleucae TaxID=81459 RepID=A0A2K8NWJ2_9MOLU|nr:hypothetical protein [Mesoplasma melaleucae]ATZ18104.1 hypothetical protein EMELA_v1c05770 [Mesoplasma melaleucae]